MLKLINYKYGYIPEFDCHIYGKIIISKQVWSAITKIIPALKKRFEPSYSWVIPQFEKDIKRTIKRKHSTLINIRVPLTEWLAETYHLPRYRQTNYMIEILD